MKQRKVQHSVLAKQATEAIHPEPAMAMAEAPNSPLMRRPAMEGARLLAKASLARQEDSSVPEVEPPTALTLLPRVRVIALEPHSQRLHSHCENESTRIE